MPASVRGLVPVLIAIAVLAVLQLLVGGSPFFVYIASIVGVSDRSVRSWSARRVSSRLRVTRR